MTPHKSKTLATWIALLGGSLGLHRFYLHGLKDVVGWLHPVPTFLGVVGIQHVLAFGQDDRLAWVLIPLGGLSVAASMLAAIVYGLTPDDRWDAGHNAGKPISRSGWAAVIGVILALLVGATVLMSTIAIGFQRWFEAQTPDQNSTLLSK